MYNTRKAPISRRCEVFSSSRLSLSTASPIVQQVPIPSVYAVLMGMQFNPPLGGGKQSAWLAASDRPAHLRAWPAPTMWEGETDEQEGHCRGRVGPVCRFEGRDGRVSLSRVFAALGRVWGGGCPDHPNSERERLREALFRALWGRSILVRG